MRKKFIFNLMLFSLFLLISPFQVFSKNKDKEDKAGDKKVFESPDNLPYPFLTFSNPVEGTDIFSPVSGRVTVIEPDDLGHTRIVVDCEQAYYWDNKDKTVLYELIIGGLKTVDIKEGEINIGDRIGTMTEHPYITSRSRDIDPFLLRTTSKKPSFFEDLWWFSPDWLIPTVLQSLTFRPVASFDDAVDDFYKRWFIEGEDPVGVTIHYFPNLDRIRAPYVLNTYPEPIEPNQALTFTEQQFYSPGLFKTQIVIKRDEGYDVVLYWQKNFDKYLRDEYSLGSEILLYCSIYALDHDNKRIIVCVRDFSFIPDEKVVDNRLKELRAE